MIKQEEYQQRLKEICEEIQKSFRIKIGIVSAISTKRCLNKIMKLNKETDNKHIAELRYAIGRTRLEYKKYCKQNNYYPDSFVNEKIKEAYIKISKKALKLETKKAYVNSLKEKFDIEYNSDRGSYIFRKVENGEITYSKEYRINNLKNLGAKRKHAIERLKRFNFGINVFDELEVNEKNIYKINPDIVHILLNEGKIDFAKLYIKEVVGGETLNNPLKIKYLLNRDNTKGRFTVEENRIMKKMARLDGLANEVVIFNDIKKKTVKKPNINILDSLKPYYNSLRRIFNNPQGTPVFEVPGYNQISGYNSGYKNTAFRASYKNTNTGKITAYGIVDYKIRNYQERNNRSRVLEER